MVFEKLNVIENLSDNWNENGAKAFSKKLINFVRKLLLNIDKDLLPDVFPTMRDSIQIEWEDGENYLEMEIFSEDHIEILRIHSDGKTEEFVIKYNQKKINELIKNFFKETNHEKTK